jgi:hypothetical protein
MHRILESGRRAVCAVVFIAITSCGGGGGGGTQGSGSPDNGSGPAVFPGVSASLKSDAIRDVTYEGLLVHEQLVEVEFTGDITALAGHSLHVVVTDPGSVYARNPVRQNISGQVLSMALQPNNAQPLPAGRITGTLQVSVCVDSVDCKTQLQNSPIDVDYDIRLRTGLNLSTDAVIQSTTYGTPLPDSIVTVSVPATAISWDFAPSVGNSFLASWLQRHGNRLVFSPSPDLVPGVYKQEFQVSMLIPDAIFPSVTERLVKNLLISHTVVATGVYSISPASIELRQSLSGDAASSNIPNLVSQVGGSFIRLGVRQDSFPAAALGHPLLGQWLTLPNEPNLSLPEVRFTYCDRGASPPVCLPVGTYLGALLMRHTDRKGVKTDFEIPVMMKLLR